LSFPYQFQAFHINAEYAPLTSRSYHTGMVNVLFLDGSTHAISSNIARQTWQALGTRAGGENVSDY
jgi:prepilin-type processing-associated H-X9-DG protein